MKKSILSILILSAIPALSYANETQNSKHIYIKANASLMSKYSAVGSNDQKVSEGRVQRTVATPRKGEHSPSLSLEFTRDISKNLELGAGITYFKAGKNVTSYGMANYSEDEFYSGPDASTGEIKTTTIGTSASQSNFTLSMPRYRSIPLYLTAKYNFPTNSDWKFYVKADLGYSFNKIKNANSLEVKTSKLTLNADGLALLASIDNLITETQTRLAALQQAFPNVTTIDQYISQVKTSLDLVKADSNPSPRFLREMAYYYGLDTTSATLKDDIVSALETGIKTLEYNKQELADLPGFINNGTAVKAKIENKVNDGEIKTITPGLIKLKVRNSLYAGVGVGMEYKNFVTEVSYSRNFVRLQDVNSGMKYKYNHDSVRLSVGYKFTLK